MLKYNQANQHMLKYNQANQHMLKYNQANQHMLKYNQANQHMLKYNQANQHMLKYNQANMLKTYILFTAANKRISIWLMSEERMTHHVRIDLFIFLLDDFQNNDSNMDLC